METEPASKRQLDCIRRLQTVVGKAEPEIEEGHMTYPDEHEIRGLFGEIGFDSGGV